MNYEVRIRKSGKWRWQKMVVKGHKLDQVLDRMDFYFPDDTVLSLGFWKQYDMRLGLCWELAVKASMAKESGVSIP